MKAKVLAAGLAAALFAGAVTQPANAQWVVYDPTNWIQNLQQVQQAIQQVQEMQKQLQQAKQTYEALSGVRGLGDVFNNPELRNYLPSDWNELYDSAASGDLAGITGAVDGIVSANSSGSIEDMSNDLRERMRRKGAVDKAAAMAAYDAALKRNQQIQSLLGQINQTSDPKAIAELQARIQGEQAAIQNETAKLQLVAMLQQAEDRLLAAKANETWGKVMAADNDKIPDLPNDVSQLGGWREGGN